MIIPPGVFEGSRPGFLYQVIVEEIPAILHIPFDEMVYQPIDHYARKHPPLRVFKGFRELSPHHVKSLRNARVFLLMPVKVGKRYFFQEGLFVGEMRSDGGGDQIEDSQNLGMLNTAFGGRRKVVQVHYALLVLVVDRRNADAPVRCPFKSDRHRSAPLPDALKAIL